MSSENIKKATFLMSSLPGGIQNDDGSAGYYVRFRLVSDDKNRKSQWSPTYFVTSEDLDIPIYFDAGGV